MQKLLFLGDCGLAPRKLQRLFEPLGFAVQASPDVAAARTTVQESRPDVVILDLDQPGAPGQETCKQIKQARPWLPVLVASAKKDPHQRIRFLELGADDYVSKPISPRELLARVRIALRRTQARSEDERAEFGQVSVDFATMEATRNGKPVAMTAQEYKLLRFLTQNPRRVFSREELLNEAWGYASYPSTRTVDNHILRLRQKLEQDMKRPRHFKTVHAVGYKFVP
jgi:DNA-binding response OmpR family regulator